MVGRNMSVKNSVTPPGIDPGTVRLVAQRLNHYATLGHTRVTMVTRVWQELEYRIDVCRVTRGAHIQHR